MKNKETLIGWVLIAALMAGFIFYQNKKLTEDQKKKAEVALAAKQDSIAAAKNAVPVIEQTTDNKPQATDSSQQLNAIAQTVVDTANLQSQYGAFGNAANGEEKTFVIENEVQKITLSSKGGQIKSVALKKYKTWDKQPLVLFADKTNLLSYQFAIDGNRVIDTKDFYFEPSGETFLVTGDSSKSFSLRLSAGDGKYCLEVGFRNSV